MVTLAEGNNSHSCANGKSYEIKFSTKLEVLTAYQIKAVLQMKAYL